MTDKYQDSYCDEGMGILHDYKFLYTTEKGVVEKCVNPGCGDKQMFPHKIPNDVYLASHIRSALQPTDPLFARNYPNFDYGLLHG